GCTTYYQFGDNTASTERTFTITNPSTTASSIDAKVFFRPNAGGADGDTTIQTISYQGVAVPQLSLHSSLTNNEIELSQTPANITITSGASNYSETMNITCDDEVWKNNVSATNTTHDVNLPATIHTYKYVATGSANGRTFTASLSVSVYQLVTVRVKDANPAWAKNFYMWDSATVKQNSAWPGETLTQKVGDWYIFSVKYPAYNKFVINDGETTGKQTIDLDIPSADICYEIGAEDHTTDGKHIYACTQAAQCPNGLFVGTIDNVDMYNGENKMVTPLVQLDPSLNVENLQISFSYGTAGIVTADQRGTAINLTATQVGSTTVTATYSIAGAESVSQTFTVNVTAAILIQAKYKGTDLGWGTTNHDNTWLHYWGQDKNGYIQMTWVSYTDNMDVYAARVPLDVNSSINFQVGYPEGETWYSWRQTDNVENVSTNGCYTITSQGEDMNRAISRDGDACWTEYQVEVDMNNGIVYYSNKITDLSETVSFFAPGNNNETLSYKKGSVRIMRNGEQAGTIDATAFDSSYVYTAKITEGMGLSNIEKYRGNYYIRTDAATATASGDDFSDGWNNYKQTSHSFTEISLYEGARYNYYWICNCKRKNDAGNLNIKACVGNEYNSDLAGMITNDTYTFGDGYITPDANGVNLRFGYNPNDNHFERSILRGSSDDLFLNVIGENIYNEQNCSTLLNEANANSKLIDKSNWVYEKVVYANITDDKPSAEVLLKSTAFNGTTVYQLGYTLDDQGKTTSTPAEHTIMASGTGQNTYELRLIYDYKTNRLTSAWAPSKLEVDGVITINSDIMFVQHENDTVSQITMKTNESKVKSLEYQLFVMEVEQDTIHVNSNLNFEHYYISLPFDCHIKDIYGIEGYLEYWGLQRYDGEERARKGWFEEDTPEGFWRWMDRSEKLNAGEGYLLSVAKGWLHEDNMFKEFDGKSALRLYFPSSKKGFDLSKSSASDAQEYTPWICNIASRKGQDSNWRMIGSTAYNTIKTHTITAANEGTSMEAAKYLYDIVVDTTRNEQGKITALTERYVAVDGSEYKYAPFKGYMYQFGGTINWQQYTRGTDELAPRRMPVRASQKMCLNVLENNTKVAHTFVELNENATADFDMNIDLAYLASGTTRLYTSDGETDYAANVLNFDNHLIPVVINPSHDGTYTFHMDNTGDVAVYLVDNVKNTKTLLSAGDVAVELEKGSSAARFALEVNVRATPTDFFNAEGNIDSVNGQKTQKLLDNGVLYLIRDGRTYDAQGRQVK
ncbi:MAG: hypothetical protein MJZ92_05445, partial [Paludibacteraceae bacterium]|nr:hypothetical protein [Paludibacteraceae bacterium]